MADTTFGLVQVSAKERAQEALLQGQLKGQLQGLLLLPLRGLHQGQQQLLLQGLRRQRVVMK